MEEDIEYLKDYITLLTADTRPLELKETGQKELAKAIETVLNALDNSISKDKIREKLSKLEKEFDFYAGRDPFEWEDAEFDGEQCNDIAIKIGVLKELLEEE